MIERCRWMACLFVASILIASFLFVTPASAQEQGPPQGNRSEQAPDQRLPGTINGTVVDQTGAVVARAVVRLTQQDQSANQEVLTGDDGQFSFANVAPGNFQLTITSPGLATQTSSGIMHAAEAFVVPPVTLTVAPNVTEVRVGLTRTEVAEEELKAEEKQRVLGFIPNFYVSYIPDAAPLSSKQKFKLAWKSTVDPVTFGVTAGIAGVQQAANEFSGYGQGAQGYGKRYGADYADLVTATFIGSAILPSLLKQDPRYFYKGTGSTRSRLLYAIANAVICKGDNKRWQANYSSILGSLASGGISNLYYPAQDRNGVGLTFANALVDIGASAATNILQEFVVRKFTPNLPKQDPAKP
jgi:hypothetical protein